jgi:two-component system, NarL family, nitrate/nitrite response regulator NarL
LKISVMIADDYPLVRDGLARALASDPAFEVVAEAGTGEEALALAREFRPDVAILDLFMPGMGGISVLEGMREEGLATRAVMFTASEQQESLMEAIEAGASGYLTKRATCEEVRRAVTSVHGGGLVITPSMAGYLLRQFTHRARSGGATPTALLTPRERQLLRMIAEGRTDKEIGAELFISARTVQNQLGRIRDKTGMRRRSELAGWAAEHARA